MMTHDMMTYATKSQNFISALATITCQGVSQPIGLFMLTYLNKDIPKRMEIDSQNNDQKNAVGFLKQSKDIPPSSLDQDLGFPLYLFIQLPPRKRRKNPAFISIKDSSQPFTIHIKFTSGRHVARSPFVAIKKRKGLSFDSNFEFNLGPDAMILFS